MADVGLRDLGSFVPGSQTAGGREIGGREPTAPGIVPKPTSEAPTVIPMPPPAKAPAIFGGDAPVGADVLGLDRTIDQIAELALHVGTSTPLAIGVLGAAGSGKSFALGRLTARVRALAEAAKGLGHGPFVPALHIQPIDAGALDADAIAGIAARVHAGLRRTYPELARELGHASRDPHVVLRDVNEKLDDARRRLDSERRALDDAGSRRARLTETVLYESAGSQVDAYARSNRAGIETRLRGFGIGGDPVRAYKDLVLRVAGSGGWLGLALRSFWAFKGQTKLIVAAIALVLVGVGLGIAVDQQATWLADLRAGPQSGVGVANWAEAHMSWLGTARGAAFLLAALAVVANLVRAFGFLQPILKGARLLDGDLDSRRRDLDGLYAHQTKRVDALDADVDRLTRSSADAERRAGGDAGSEPSPFAPEANSQATQFFDGLAALMAQPKAIAVPKRVLLVIDHLDAVTPDRARAILDGLHRTLGAGLVTVAAFDPARIAGGGDLDRWVQVPLRLDVEGGDRDYGRLVHGLLGRAGPAPETARLDASRSALDQPVGEDEAALLAALSGLAGPSPRAVKRFVDLYRLARLDGDHRGALALLLAISIGGTESEKAMVAATLDEGDASQPFAPREMNRRLRSGIETASGVDGRFTIADATKAARRAALFVI